MLNYIKSLENKHIRFRKHAKQDVDIYHFYLLFRFKKYPFSIYHSETPNRISFHISFHEEIPIGALSLIEVLHKKMVQELPELSCFRLRLLLEDIQFVIEKPSEVTHMIDKHAHYGIVSMIPLAIFLFVTTGLYSGVSFHLSTLMLNKFFPTKASALLSDSHVTTFSDLPFLFLFMLLFLGFLFGLYKFTFSFVFRIVENFENKLCFFYMNYLKKKYRYFWSKKEAD